MTLNRIILLVVYIVQIYGPTCYLDITDRALRSRSISLSSSKRSFKMCSKIFELSHLFQRKRSLPRSGPINELVQHNKLITSPPVSADGSLMYERVMSRAELEARRSEAGAVPAALRRAYDDINGLDSQYRYPVLHTIPVQDLPMGNRSTSFTPSSNSDL
ncbi:unnamed protein product [Euphydryas editha]|uniref:Pheromone biosynthesis activating neuropeptide n=1 Tax=Euphydryas editha TaxID=104508 RepID=A0AAU9U6H6_EUPED|nr:unnamed protein product [Euphydryas editha]